MATIDDRIAALESKLKQERAKKQQLEARKRAASAKVERAKDTRRKILAGAVMLELIERDPGVRGQFMARLDRYLTRADDRALFDLPVAPSAPAAAPSDSDWGDLASDGRSAGAPVG